MNDIERARKIIAGSVAARADIEAAISECKTAVTADEVAIATLEEGRGAALVAGGDQLKAYKAEHAETEELLATRQALVKALETRLGEVTENERRGAIASARAKAESVLKEAVTAIGDYPAAREKILACVEKIKSANAAADNFERRYMDEPRIGRAEVISRPIGDLAEEILSEEIVELWASGTSGSPVNERDLDRIIVDADNPKRGILPKSGVSSDFAGGYPVQLREFRRITFLPEIKGVRLEPLVSGVQLPPLLQSDQQRREAVRLVPVILGGAARLASAFGQAVA